MKIDANEPGITGAPNNLPGQAKPQALTVCVLSSGSKGNAIYISDGETALLLDAGLSAKEIVARMALRGLCPQDLSAILISHHHGDHVKGIGPMARRYGLAIYTLPKTVGNCRLGPLRDIRFFEKGQPFRINSMTIHAFDTPHDAVDSVGFVFTTMFNRKIGVATDLGTITNAVRENLRGCNLLVLEANHDVNMLLNGNYPWYLKQRIKGRDGHLSNADCCALLGEIMHDTLEHVIFAHLSEENNTREKVLEVMQPVFENVTAQFTIAEQGRPTEIILSKG